MKRFGLLGEHLAHSLSPKIHSLLGDYEYQLYEKSPDGVESFIKNNNLNGMNVTVPYKKVAYLLCDVLNEQAKEIGSVNTVIYKDNKIYGYNTDFFGFSYLLKSNRFEIENKKCLVLGSGGASLTVKSVLSDFKAREIVVISRSGENNYKNLERHSDADIIVNTTPVGMFPNVDEAPLSLKIFKSCSGIADIVYNPAKTKLLKEAELLNIKSCNGLSMLVAQAVKASEIFTGKEIPDKKIEEVITLMENTL